MIVRAACWRQLSCAVMLLAPAAWAQTAADGPSYSLTAATLVEHDGNFFRLPDGAAPRQFGINADSRGDTLVVPSASVDANLVYSLQRLQLSGSLSRELLRNNPAFDVTDLTYRATWQWQIASEWNGELTDSQQQQRMSFADVRAPEADRQTTRIRHASAAYRPRPDRHLGVSLDQYVGSNSLGQLQIYDYRITVERAEVGMQSGWGSEVVLGASTTHGDYPNQPIFAFAPVDNSYRQNQLDLSTHYVASEKLKFDLKAGYAKRRYPQVSRRNFGGLVGNLAADWQATAELGARLSVTRDLDAVSDFNRIYTVTTAADLKLRYQPSVVTEVTLDARSTRILFQGDPQNFFTLLTGPAPYREDRYSDLNLSLAWMPSDRLTLQLSQILGTRNSNVALYGYRDWTSALNVQYRVGN